MHIINALTLSASLRLKKYPPIFSIIALKKILQ